MAEPLAAGAGASDGPVWARAPLDEPTLAAVHALVADVVARGGAVGWLEVPPPAQVRAWLEGALGEGARVLLLRAAGDVLAMGLWQRLDAAVMRQNAEVRKVMTASSARGCGLARRVVAALVEDADRAGVEVLSLGARGNNHAALGLYLSLGFVVTGRRPDWIAVGQERFDEVLLHLDLRPGRPAPEPPLRRHGGLREGTGST